MCLQVLLSQVLVCPQVLVSQVLVCSQVPLSQVLLSQVLSSQVLLSRVLSSPVVVGSQGLLSQAAVSQGRVGAPGLAALPRARPMSSSSFQAHVPNVRRSFRPRQYDESLEAARGDAATKSVHVLHERSQIRHRGPSHIGAKVSELGGRWQSLVPPRHHPDDVHLGLLQRGSVPLLLPALLLPLLLLYLVIVLVAAVDSVGAGQLGWPALGVAIPSLACCST